MYGELGLLDQGIHNFYLRVFTILFKERTPIKKKNFLWFFKKLGCATAHPPFNVAPPLVCDTSSKNENRSVFDLSDRDDNHLKMRKHQDQGSSWKIPALLFGNVD